MAGSCKKKEEGNIRKKKFKSFVPFLKSCATLHGRILESRMVSASKSSRAGRGSSLMDLQTTAHTHAHAHVHTPHSAISLDIQHLHDTEDHLSAANMYLNSAEDTGASEERRSDQTAP